MIFADTLTYSLKPAVWWCQALQISHPANNTRDLALFDHLRRLLQCRHILSLPILVNRILGRDIGLITEDPVRFDDELYLRL